MASTSQNIPLCEKGGDRTLIEADYANRLIVPLNAIIAGKVAPEAGTGFFAYAGGAFILDLTAFDQRFRVLEAQYANLASRMSNVENAVENITNAVNSIIGALNGASIDANAACDNAGTITVNVSLTIPNVPSPIT